MQSRLHLPPDQQFSHPESDLVRALYDCPDVPVGPTGHRCRVVVATHPTSEKKSRVGLTRSGLVYELFFTALPQSAFTAADVVALYLHRGAFEPTLADEDQEQDPDRWCSHSAAGQQAWQIISQWVWNLRLELGHQFEPTPMRTTEFAPARAEAFEGGASPFGYASPEAGLPWKAGRFSGNDFAPQADGTLRCPAGKSLHATEERREADGTLRVLFAARIRDCRDCQLREQCQWHGAATKKPRRVSLLLHPLGIGAAPLLVARIGAVGTLDGRPCSSVAANGWRCRWNRRARLTLRLRLRLFPWAAGPLSALVARAASSQWAPQDGWQSDDQAVRRPRKLCHLTRHGPDVMRGRFGDLSVPSPRLGFSCRVARHVCFCCLSASHPRLARVAQSSLPLCRSLECLLIVPVIHQLTEGGTKIGSDLDQVELPLAGDLKRPGR